jgi:hypothetical protein
MPAPDCDSALLAGVSLTNERGRWRVHVRCGERLYDLGTFMAFADTHRPSSASALEKALGSPENARRTRW